MMSAGMPFIGLVHNVMDDDGVRDKNLGPVLFYAFGKFATTPLSDDKNDKGLPVRFIIRAISKILIAKIRGQHKPNAFFDEFGKPVSEPVISAVDK